MKNNLLNFLSRRQTGNDTVATMVAKDTTFLQKAINYCLAFLVFAVPLFFLPFTFEAREFNKQALIFLGAVVILGFWVVKIVTTRRIAWVRTSLDYAVAAFLFVYLIASLLSVDKVSSFLGYYGRFTGSFISVLVLVILYFLVVNNLRTERATKTIMNWLTWGSSLALVYGFMQLMGWFVIPFSFAKTPAFNSVGSIWGLAIFAVINLVLVQWHWLTDKQMSVAKNIGLWIITAVGFATVFAIDVFVGWIVLAASMVVFMAMGLFVSSEERLNPMWFWKPMLLLVLSVLFLAFSFIPNLPDPRDIVSVNVPREVQLANSTNLEMVKNSLSQKPILGYGPGTTGIAFGNIKPEVLNKTVVWNLNFDKASSEIANIMIETGLIGLLMFELISIMFIIYAFNYLRHHHDYAARSYAFGFFAVFSVLYISHFFYYFNTTFYFLYWLSLAGFMAVANWRSAQSAEPSASSSQRAALSWMFASVLVLAVLAVGLYFEVSTYVAEASYTSGLKKLSVQNPDFNAAGRDFGRAVRLNPYRDVYWLANGQNLIFRASVEAAKSEPNIREFSVMIRDLLVSGQQAAKLSPNKAANWSVLAQFYSNVRPLTSRANSNTPIDTAIIDSWKKAIERDSKNPALYVHLARAYVNSAEIIDPKIAGSGADSDNDGLSDEKEKQLGSNPNNSDSNQNEVNDGDEVKAGFNPAGTGRLSASELQSFIRVDQARLAEAETALRKAEELKPNLVESIIELARVYERTNRLKEAQQLLDSKFKTYNNSIDLAFELGRVEYNMKNYPQAEKLFNAVIKAQPKHANSNYSLGLIFLQRGERDKALAQFEKTREITGPNLELERLINGLKVQANASNP